MGMGIMEDKKMILYFDKLGSWGRLGNQLFEIASTIGMAHKYGGKAFFPAQWEYRRFFNIPDEYFGKMRPNFRLTERQFHYDPNFLTDAPGDATISIEGTFQNENYWIEIKDKIKEWLMPAGFPKIGEGFSDTSVGIHIRRGDYVGNPGYTQCDADYFKAVIKRYFSDPKYRFYIITDDIEYVMEHFDTKRFNIEKRSIVDDLGVMASCFNHILSPSSFSWWGTYLSREGGINIRPKRTHIGKMEHYDESTYWPAEWKAEEVTDINTVKVRLLCYADEKFKAYQDRLTTYAERSKQFDEILAYNRKDITSDFIYSVSRNILDCQIGGGYWLWKPWLILKTLDESNDGDLLLYMDSGDMFFGNIRNYLVEQMIDKDILLTDGGIRNAIYTKQYCFDAMDCNGPEFKEAKQVEAGVILIKNTVRSRRIIKDWLHWCQIKAVVGDYPSNDNDPEFIAHRWDQSILTNLMVLYNLPSTSDIRSYVICNVEDLNVGKYVDPTDLKDFTFVIPVKYDHPDRVENLTLVVNFLQKWFDTNIIVGEQGPRRKFEFVEKMGVKYIQFPEGDFHRTRFINKMTRMTETPYVFNWDADVIVPAEQIVTCANLLRGGYEFVYPYDGAFLHCSRLWIPMIKFTLDTKSFEGFTFKGINDNSVGGAVGFNKEAFIRVGMENENYVSHAPEDVDRAIRFDMLGKMTRVKGPLYHFEHWMGSDSTHNGHPFVAINRREIRTIRSMTKEQLWEYIKTWTWI